MPRITPRSYPAGSLVRYRDEVCRVLDTNRTFRENRPCNTMGVGYMLLELPSGWTCISDDRETRAWWVTSGDTNVTLVSRPDTGPVDLDAVQAKIAEVLTSIEAFRERNDSPRAFRGTKNEATQAVQAVQRLKTLVAV